MRKIRVKLKSERIPKILRELRQKGIQIAYLERDPADEIYTLYFEGDEKELKKCIEEAQREKLPFEFKDLERILLLDPQSLEKLIEKEVTDFDTMKAYLKKLSLLTLFLYKKLMEGELS